MTVAELLDRCSSHELGEWLAVRKLEAEDDQEERRARELQRNLTAQPWTAG